MRRSLGVKPIAGSFPREGVNVYRGRAAERRVSRTTRACLTPFRGHEKADHGVRDAVGSGDRRRSDQAHAREAAPIFRLTRPRIEQALTSAGTEPTRAVRGATTSGPNGPRNTAKGASGQMP